MGLEEPKVMAILNLTPDSFCRRCSSIDEAVVLADAVRALDDGADILDLGACSTRPGSDPPDADEEWQRLAAPLRAVRNACPDAVISVDTYRASVAERAIEAGADIINDISGGQMDDGMFPLMARARVPYILTHLRGTPATMQQHTDYHDLMSEMVDYLQRRLDRLHQSGCADVIIDPGFGFAKTMQQNYHLLRHLNCLKILDAPVLVGLSRKSMLYQAVGTDAEHALNATTAAHMIALCQGADILRVHDVKAARETIKIFKSTYPVI